MSEANAGSVKAKLLLEADAFKRAMQDARNEMRSTQGEARSTSRDMETINKASLAIGAAVATGIGASTKVAMDFEAAMSRVKAISGATDEEFQQLSSIAKEMGESTQFSASQAAAALEYLSMSGFKVEQQIAALPSVLNLAAAAKVDLGQSADIVSNIMTGFGITADETGSAVDILVKTMTTANTDLPQLGQAMLYVGPVAKNLGLSLEETAASVAQMSNAGIQGSQAGTALRAALLALANPTGQTVKAMEALNIEVTNADGKMKPLPDLIGHIASKMANMEDAQKTATVAQLVGTEAASGFLALLDVGEDKLKDYTRTLENSGGVAEEVAKIQNDNVKGAFLEFQSALEGAGIKLGDEFLPMFREVITTGTDIVRMISDLNPGVVATGVKMAGTAASVALVATSVAKLTTLMRGLMVSMGPAGWIIAGASILAGVLVGVKEGYERVNEVNLETAKSFNDQHTELSAVVEQFEDLRVKANLTTEELGELLDIRDKMANTTDADALQILQDKYDGLLEKSGLTNQELEKLISLNDTIIDKAPHVADAHSKGGNAIADVNDNLRDYVQLLQDTALQELEMERMKWAENRAKHTKDIRDAELEINEIKTQMNMLSDYQNLTQEEIYTKLTETADKLTDYTLTEAEILALEQEREVLQGLFDEGLAGHIQKLQDQKKEQEKIISKAETELAKGEEIDNVYSNILLKKIGINSEGQEGIQLAETQLTKLREQRTEVERQIAKHGDKNGLSQQQLDYLDEEIRKHESVIGQLSRETGFSSTLVDTERRRHDQIRFISDTLSGQERIARNINAELGKSISKRVNIVTVGDTRGAYASQYHTGGIVGKPSIGEPIPKMHEGGAVNSLLQNGPMHNEIDIRALRNEMILTEGMQANLVDLLHTGRIGYNGAGGNDINLEPLVNAMLQLANRPVNIEIDGETIASATYDINQQREYNETTTMLLLNGIRDK
ncbi:phage tail tape measure protein [Sutcliffiella horikoshii]|uniref:phage tail tape measure protein n=1 Tax=Sutcliffiella horikoshii TaxID=79883 RepID=UPI00384DEECD